MPPVGLPLGPKGPNAAGRSPFVLVAPFQDGRRRADGGEPQASRCPTALPQDCVVRRAFYGWGSLDRAAEDLARVRAQGRGLFFGEERPVYAAVGV